MCSESKGREMCVDLFEMMQKLAVLSTVQLCQQVLCRYLHIVIFDISRYIHGSACNFFTCSFPPPFCCSSSERTASLLWNHC